MAQESRQLVPPNQLNAQYPVIDTDPHWRRAFRYARREDWTVGAGLATVGPIFMAVTERYAPSFSGRGAFPPMFRLSIAVGLVGGFGIVYQRSCGRFLGVTENEREVQMDMREMVDKVKKGEPLFSALLSHVVPWANFVNHNQHGVDTAKYYQQAERELEAEK